MTQFGTFIDLSVAGLAIQGKKLYSAHHDHGQVTWLKKLSVKYWLNGESVNDAKDVDDGEVFVIPSYYGGIDEYYELFFKSVVPARHVKITVVEAFEWASIRAGILVSDDNQIQCESNVCICDYNGAVAGLAATGVDCPENGASKCMNCREDATLYLNGHDCFKKCTCLNGVADEEHSTCKGNIKCKTCNAGYHLENNACVINQCTCDHGSATQGQNCRTHQNHVCGSCNAGYHLNNNNLCVKNVCVCDNGLAAQGEACPRHQDHYCESCNFGFHRTVYSIYDIQCAPNVCNCVNGNAVSHLSCPNHGEDRCLNCHAGYHLNGATRACDINVCSCDYGTAATGTNCPTHAAQKCTACWNYNEYHFQNDRCHRSQLKLSNGFTGYIMVGSETSSWNSVCDDGFQEVEAQIVCKQVVRQLGESNGRPFNWGTKTTIAGAFIGDDAKFNNQHRENMLATFPDPFKDKGDDTIMIDDLACAGHESSIFECPHDGLFQHDCGHSEDVWIICNFG